MLILARKPGQRVFLGPTITLTLIEFQRGEGRLGIDAPPDVLVFREEIAPPGFQAPPASARCGAAAGEVARLRGLLNAALDALARADAGAAAALRTQLG